MNHLTAAELIDLLDGQLASDRAAHADSCNLCRAQVEDLRGALVRSAEVDVPEPSPLFWEHLSQRVREGLDTEIASDHAQRFSWVRAHRWALVAAATAVMVMTAGNWLSDSGRHNAPATPAQVADSLDDEELEKAWGLVRAAADGIAWEDAQEAGIAAAPGSADSALQRLTDTERDRLIALLEEELKRTGA